MLADSYADVCSGASDVAREQERMAFDKGLALLEDASQAPEDQARVTEATRYIQTLWTILIRDLVDPANDLSKELKDNLISIGIWSIKEADAIIAGKSQNFAGLIDINRSIRAGLAS